MAVIDVLKPLVQSGISAGISTARSQGQALRADIDNLIKPQMEDVVKQIASITEARLADRIEDDQAQDAIRTQLDRIQPLLLALGELSLLAVQTIVNAILDAIKQGVDGILQGAIGITLL